MKNVKLICWDNLNTLKYAGLASGLWIEKTINSVIIWEAIEDVYDIFTEVPHRNDKALTRKLRPLLVDFLKFKPCFRPVYTKKFK